MKTILITGGAGYLGSVLVEILLHAGHEVAVLDLFPHTSLAPLAHDPCLSLLRGDAQYPEAFAAVARMADVVIPLAAIVGAPACDRAGRDATWRLNYQAVAKLLGLLSVDQLVLFPNTNSGYGTSAVACTEKTPLFPVSEYGLSKREAEAAVLQHGSAVVLRFATLFGCSYRMRLDLMVNDFVLRAVRDRCVTLYSPEARRNFLHVRDAAHAFLFAIEHADQMKGQVFNCGLSDANLTKRELCAEIAREVPEFVYTDAPVGEDPDQRDYVVLNDKLEALGWRPHYRLRDGIRELAEAFRALPFNAEHRNAW